MGEVGWTRDTENPGAVILTRVPSSRWGKGFFFHLSVQTLLSRCPPFSPLCAIACINFGALVKSQTLAATPLFGHTKILHTLTGMVSAALAAAAPYPGMATRISRKGQRSAKKKY